MLTPAQQKIRRELEELHLKGLLRGKDEQLVHKRRTKLAWLFISLTALLLVSPLLARFYKTSESVRIHQYLLEVHQLEQESSVLFGEEAVSNNRLDGLSPNTASFADLKKLQSLVDKSKKLKVPRGLEDHKQDMTAVMEQRITAMKSPTKRNLVTLDVKIGLARDSLAKALKEEKVRYKVLDDDTIQFWIDNKVYQY